MEIATRIKLTESIKAGTDTGDSGCYPQYDLMLTIGGVDYLINGWRVAHYVSGSSNIDGSARAGSTEYAEWCTCDYDGGVNGKPLAEINEHAECLITVRPGDSVGETKTIPCPDNMIPLDFAEDIQDAIDRAVDSLVVPAPSGKEEYAYLLSTPPTFEIDNYTALHIGSSCGRFIAVRTDQPNTIYQIDYDYELDTFAREQDANTALREAFEKLQEEF